MICANKHDEHWTNRSPLGEVLDQYLGVGEPLSV